MLQARSIGGQLDGLRPGETVQRERFIRWRQQILQERAAFFELRRRKKITARAR